MNFLDMGIFEIGVILLVAIMVFGPGRIPEIARQLGRGLRAFRRVTTDLTKEFTKALDSEDKGSSSKKGSGGGLDKSLDKLEKGAKSLNKFLGGQDKKKGSSSKKGGSGGLDKSLDKLEKGAKSLNKFLGGQDKKKD